MKKVLYCVLLLSCFNASSQINCPSNIRFDLGNFTNWQCYTGTVSQTGSSNCSTAVNIINKTPSGPTAGLHAIIAPNSNNDPFGGFSLNPGNNNVVKLGSVNQITVQAETISYAFTVPSNSAGYNLGFKYAVVHQAPLHCLTSQPFFEAKVYDVTAGQYINCASYLEYATPGQNGFQQSSNTSSGSVYYKTWTPVSFNLSAYPGHSLRIEFTNANCIAVGHWAYAYVDVSDICGAAVTGNQFCQGASATISAPPGFQSYSWWNSTLTQNLGISQTLTLMPPPTVPTVYALKLGHLLNAGCIDTVFITASPQPFVIANAGPDGVVCPNNPGIMIGTPALPGYSYHWSPAIGMGVPVAQPTVTPTSTTNYILTVTDGASGCTNKDTVTIYVAATPPAVTISISGNVLSSPSPVGNQWYLNGNAIPGATDQTYTATVPGMYSVIITVNGCSSAASNSITYSLTGINTLVSDWKLICGPNPVNDALIISHRSMDKLDVEVIDLLGRTLLTRKDIPSSCVIDLSAFEPGSYIVRFTNSGTKKEVRKLMVKM